jgi:hypothetical protein
VPRFGKDKNARNEELDRQAAEEVERLTRRGGPPGMGGGGMGGGGGFGGGPSIGMPSPLEMMAAEIADGPRPVKRGAQPPRRAPSRQQQAFTPMPSGEVGSSFGPGGLNPGPRGGGGAPPPPAFGGGEDYGGHVTGPSVHYNPPTDYDEEEEMSITELALMDHAKHTGYAPEDLVLQYDASSAEEMRDIAMRQFYERQQARRPGAGSDNPFAPAGMRRGPAPTGGGPVRRDDPAAAGGALAQRLANKRRREEELARRAAAPEAKPAASSAAPQARTEAEVDEGALARVLARRRAALGVDNVAAPAPEPAPRRRPAAPTGLRAVPTPRLDDDQDDDAPSLEDMAASIPTRRPSAAKKAPATKAAVAKKRAPAKKAPAAKAAATKAPAKKAPAAKKTAPAKKAPAAKGGASLAKAPATKAKAPAGKAKTVFCMECGEKNPAIAKFCFNCGNRLAVPEG